MKTNGAMAVRDISNENEIEAYIHCGKCLDEMPQGVSPKDWQRIQAGWTTLGLQVWCTRHECNVMHVDFQGQKHPANTNA